MAREDGPAAKSQKKQKTPPREVEKPDDPIESESDTEKKVAAREYHEMFTRLTFSDEAVDEIVRAGLTTLESLAPLQEDTIKSIMKGIREHCDEQPSVLAEHYLQCLCWGIRHYVRISRKLRLKRINPSWCMDLVTQRKIETDSPALSDARDSEYPVYQGNDLPRLFETVNAFLLKYRGPSGVILSYVVRDNLIPLMSETDPPANYPSVDDEMIARAPILYCHYDCIVLAPIVVAKHEIDGPFHPNFLQDMTRVWDILFQIFGKQSCWTHVKKTQKTKSGRTAYFILKTLLIGERFMQIQVKQIETALASFVYKGRSSGWNLMKYITKFKEQWVLCDSLIPYGFRGYD